MLYSTCPECSVQLTTDVSAQAGARSRPRVDSSSNAVTCDSLSTFIPMASLFPVRLIDLRCMSELG